MYSQQSPHYLRHRLSSVGDDDDSGVGADGFARNWSDGGSERYRKEEEEKRRKARDEEQLRLAGLRRRSLVILFAWLALLSLLAVLLLILHISLVVVLQMSPRGMRSLRIFDYEDVHTGKSEPAVHFSADQMDLGKVVAVSGKVLGPREKELNIRGSRVVVGEAENGTRMLFQESTCRLEGTEHFQVRQPGTSGKVLFSARHPLVSIDRRIRRIASGHIVTNKLRSPVDEQLRIVGQDVSLRGNERIQMEAKAVNASAENIALKTTEDGSLRLSARRIFLGSKWRTLPVSSSPALTASVDAFRVCICHSRSTPGGRSKLFAVPGNKPCEATTTICH